MLAGYYLNDYLAFYTSSVRVHDKIRRQGEDYEVTVTPSRLPISDSTSKALQGG